MIIKGEPLIKFQSSDRINDLQNGHIYMKSLEWFRKHEKENGDVVVGDSFEAMFHMNEGSFIRTDTGEIWKINDELISTSASNDYVYCMFGIYENCSNFVFTQEQKEKIKGFGDTALLILDKDEFYNRIRKAASKEGYEIHVGFVRYYDEKQDSVNLVYSLIKGMYNIAFWKRKKYAYQQEVRFLVHAQDNEKDYIEFNIGDIRDISKVFSTDEILNSVAIKIKDDKE